MNATRCAVYARFSCDRQKAASIDDQLRKCFEFAQAKGWLVDPLHIYVDEGLSAVGSDRPGYRALLSTASEKPRVLDAILVDDTSRLSRSLPEVINVQQRFAFQGVRLIAVSQGIDSSHEQAEVLFAIHGLVDSLYVRELAKKTHRGLEGLALKALHTGGRCLGYRTFSCEGGFRLRIDEEEAKLVRYIFRLYSQGISFKRIARRLTEEQVPTIRTARSSNPVGWPHTGIREILRRELYSGQLIWNKRRFVKSPGTNRRISRIRPESEWIRVSAPELRIVPPELWAEVQRRLAGNSELFNRRHPSLERVSRQVSPVPSGQQAFPQ